MEKDSISASIARVVGEGNCYVILVTSGPRPRFAYTVGAFGRVGVEFCLLGAILFDRTAVKEILEAAYRASVRVPDLDALMSQGLEVPEVGHFKLAKMQASWCSELLLAAQDHYNTSSVEGVQIIPDRSHRTIDVPDTTVPFLPGMGGPWGLDARRWRYDWPVKSVAGIDFEALRGRPLIRVTRWEEDYFEAFSRSAEYITEDNSTIVPFGLIAGMYPDLPFIADLAVGEHARLREDGLWDRWFVESGTADD